MPNYRVSIDVICNSTVYVEAVSPEAASAALQSIIDEGPTAIRAYLRKERLDMADDVATFQVSDVEEEDDL